MVVSIRLVSLNPGHGTTTVGWMNQGSMRYHIGRLERYSTLHRGLTHQIKSSFTKPNLKLSRTSLLDVDTLFYLDYSSSWMSLPHVTQCTLVLTENMLPHVVSIHNSKLFRSFESYILTLGVG